MEGKPRFATLDGLRGIAALAVVTRHVPDSTLLNWSQGSTLAVDLFFVLSGFVLMHAYNRRLSEGLSPFTFLSCAWRGSIRNNNERRNQYNARAKNRHSGNLISRQPEKFIHLKDRLSRMSPDFSLHLPAAAIVEQG
jgi:hypothetical protein